MRIFLFRSNYEWFIRTGKEKEIKLPKNKSEITPLAAEKILGRILSRLKIDSGNVEEFHRAIRKFQKIKLKENDVAILRNLQTKETNLFGALLSDKKARPLIKYDLVEYHSGSIKERLLPGYILTEHGEFYLMYLRVQKTLKKKTLMP